MIAKSWIVVCDQCTRYQPFPTIKPPEKMTDPDKLYRNREQLPAVEVEKQEILDELTKRGWLVSDGEICPQCSAKTKA